MQARIIHTKFWTDSYILSLSSKERLLFLFLFTNDKVGLGSIYEISPTLIQLSTNLSLEEIKKTKEKFSKDNKVFFYKDWVYLVNAEKYQKFTGEKNEIAKERELSLVSGEVKKYFERYPSHRVSKGYFPPEIPLVINNKKSVINNKKSVINNKKHSSLKSLKEKDFKEIAEKYKVSVDFVVVVFDRMSNWCLAKGKKYKDYYRALMNWVSRSKEEKLERGWQNGKKRAIDASDL